MTTELEGVDLMLEYGPHSPFDAEERETISVVVSAIEAADSFRAGEFVEIIRRHVSALDELGEALSRYPSPSDTQVLGERLRGLETLVDTLCGSSAANFEIYLPTRAFLGRAIVMAESNFYRLLRHVCVDALPEGERRTVLVRRVERLLRNALYTRLCEDVLSSIASDKNVAREIRSEAVVALAQIWDQQLQYRLAEFFPLLEATWEARQHSAVVGGTLSGASEMMELLQAGCHTEFVDYFARPMLSDDELGAFREFLFGKTTEELAALERQMQAEGTSAIALDGTPRQPVTDVASVLYEFFRRRHLQALARRFGELPGPKHTAEEYVMIYYLDRKRDAATK